MWFWLCQVRDPKLFPRLCSGKKVPSGQLILTINSKFDSIIDYLEMTQNYFYQEDHEGIEEKNFMFFLSFMVDLFQIDHRQNFVDVALLIA